MTPVRLTLRLPPELHQLLTQRARAERRSLNGEIEYLLWQTFTLSVDAYVNERAALRPKGSRPVMPGA
jgi:hypothetical protein